MVGDHLSGNGVRFTETHRVLIISFLVLVLFTQIIVDKITKVVLFQTTKQ